MAITAPAGLGDRAEVVASAEAVSAGAALAEEYQGLVASAGSGAGAAEARLEEIPAGAPRAASSFTAPFAGNPRAPFRKPFASDRAKRALTPISKNITSSTCSVTCPRWAMAGGVATILRATMTTPLRKSGA